MVASLHAAARANPRVAGPPSLSCGDVSGGIERDTAVRRLDSAIAERTGEDTLVVKPDSDRYVRLNRTGTWIWDALATPSRVDELAAGVAREFGISRSDALRDVRAFLDQLAEQGFVNPAKSAG
jgi:hypothetical protein